jgi:succinate-semialdehyde dehydrogenase/glutarate-semialdehyde dehydrogenase
MVFDDANPVHAAKGAQLVKFLNTGQACISPNRMYVSEKLVDDFVGTLEERVSKMRAGSGFEEGVTIGPLVNEAAVAKVEKQVNDAAAQGAEIVCGGSRLTDGDLGKGHFFAPTVLNGITPDMRIYREETFGPVAPVIPFSDEREALALANDTHYGLAAYVYTRDFARAMRMFEGLNFGIIGINDINPASAAAPFGGMKDSGLGREGSREGIVEYLETKVGGFSI